MFIGWLVGLLMGVFICLFVCLPVWAVLESLKNSIFMYNFKIRHDVISGRLRISGEVP